MVYQPDLQSCSVVKLVCARGPDPRPLLATSEQEYEISGVNPATVSGPSRERDWGREEGEGEQERV